jgi:hypothetical protein
MGAAHASSFSNVVVNKDSATALDVLWTWDWSGAPKGINNADLSTPSLTFWSAEASGYRDESNRTGKKTYFLNVTAGPAIFGYEYDSGLTTGKPNQVTSFYDSATIGGRTYTLSITQGASANSLSANLVATAPVPEPESYAMFLAGLGLVGVITTRRRRGA